MQPHEAEAQDGKAEHLPERRLAAQRKIFDANNCARKRAACQGQELVLPRLTYLIVAMIFGIGGASLMAEAGPGITAALAMGLAMAILLLANALQPLFAKQDMQRRRFSAAACIIAPLSLFGAAMTAWVRQGGVEWDCALGSMLLVSGVAAIYLRRHAGAMLAGQLALWFWAVLTYATLWGFVAFTVAVLIALLLTIEQFRVDREANMLRAEHNRLQLHASEILSDYEETRQGWFWETDQHGNLTYVSSPIATMIGRTVHDLQGKPLHTLFDLAATGDEGHRVLDFHLQSRSAFTDLPLRAALADRELWWSISGRAYFNPSGDFIGFRGSGSDLTEKHRSQQYETRLARYDSLTGLANRHEMTQTLEKLLASPQEANRAGAVMLLDLDKFKRVNDTMGHPVGDALLKQVAKRLEKAVGTQGQIGRLGGDEFMVIVPGHVPSQMVATLAERTISALSQPYSIDGRRIVIGASAGISMAPSDGLSSDMLIRNADLSLYAAKDAGRGQFQFFGSELRHDAQARSQLESDLRSAITRDELSLEYQPLIDIATEEIAGFEAFLRWRHPEHGWVAPDRFVALAEDTGLMIQIGAWVLQRACHNLKSWPEHLRLAVNVSPIQFCSANFPAIVKKALREAQVSPARLQLEVTEIVFLSDDQGAEVTFKELKRIGVRIALDDFGTGYSSLGYLKRAPFDVIKIDRSFIRGMTDPSSSDGAIIASITSLAHALGMETIAEGVETMEELDVVRMLGCSYVQGYVYERPLTPAATLARLEKGLSATAYGERQARVTRHEYSQNVDLHLRGKVYRASIRNISSTGALLEGLFNVPPGTRLKIDLGSGTLVSCIARWRKDNRLGVAFDQLLERDMDGRIPVLSGLDGAQEETTTLRCTG